ncbi:hypothetical protein [Streptomyces sp. MBT27]|uniref:hypothetical protein n=1 Tax=Streptomyces sp. MBT27 TaxID=1488356 RepID=UPI00141DB2C1|nr:hypothetical protein [Streptomyces sp. MBT27]
MYSPEATEHYTVWIRVQHAARLKALGKKNRIAESLHVEQLVDEGLPSVEARLAARRIRMEVWPPAQVVVARALKRRLDEEDLRGPWRPLTQEEADRMTLSGRWPGHNPGSLIQRHFTLPADLLTRLRTAAWRVSEEPLSELERLDLWHFSEDMSPEDRELRHEFIAQVYAPPRIVRQALDRYGPQPAESNN